MGSFKVVSPARVDLAGGTLDIWPLYCLVGGAKTVNLAIDLCVTVTVDVAPNSGFEISIQGVGGETVTLPAGKMPDPGSVPEALRLPAFVVGAYISHRVELPDLRVKLGVSSDIPAQSGLGGSSALCVALARAMARLFGDFIQQGWQWKMVEWARDVEAAYLGHMTGTQDYLASLFGGAACYTYEYGMVDRVAYPDATIAGFAERMMVLYSGETHDSSLSNWEILKGAFQREAPVMRGLQAIRQISEDLDAELQSGNLSWKHIGQLLNREWDVRKTLFRVNTPRLDQIVQMLSGLQVLGAKVCGAAQGGSLVVLVDPDRRAAIARECERLGVRVLRAQVSRPGTSVTES